MTKFTRRSRKTRTMPGTTVARKHFSTDWRVIQAWMICIELGGISSPCGAALEIGAAENPYG